MFKPLKKISLSQDRFNEVLTVGEAAKELLNNERFQFFRDYVNEGLKSVETSILNNTVKEVREVYTLSDKIKKIFVTPKKEQIEELSGAYKWIKKMMVDLEQFVRISDELREKEAKKEVLIIKE